MTGRRRVRAAWIVGTAAALILIVTTLGWRFADRAARRAENDSADAERQADEISEELAESGTATEFVQLEVEVLRGLFEPGVAEAMRAVYLQVAVEACADPEATDESVIEIAADTVSSDFDILAAHPGWEAAIDSTSVQAARAACGDGP